MKVLLVDDHALFRAGLVLLLRLKHPGVEIHEAADVAQALDRLRRPGCADLCLLDLDLKARSGLEVLQRARELAPAMAMVIVSATESPTAVLACIEAGAMSYIPKSASPEVLSQALDRVLAGEVFLPDEFAALAAGTARTAQALTRRQREVLIRLNRGLPNKLIARELGITEYTVKDHIADILRVLGVQNRTQAVIEARHLTLFDGLAR